MKANRFGSNVALPKLTFKSCFTSFALASAVLMSAGVQAQAQPAAADNGTKIVPLFGTPLSDIKGKEGVMLTIEYAPGASTPMHRHDAHVFVYVLEGSIIMKAKGKPAVTLNAGQTFYEDPKDVHEVSKNASDTKSAKFLVFLVKKKGTPPVLPAK